MAFKGSASATIKVGDTNNPDVTVSITPETEEISEYQRGRIVLAAGATTALAFGGVTAGKMIWTEAVLDSAPATDARIAIGINTVTIPTDVSDFLLAMSTGATTSITSVVVKNLEAATARIEYLIAGD